MPRTARASVAGSWYHVLNRGNCRAVVFHKPADYDAFVRAVADATVRLPVDLLGYCLMPNHFHVAMRTHADGDLGRRVRWFLVAHAQRYHRHYQTTGHVWQGRYKAFPVQDDDHSVGVLRYVERNALRAEMVPVLGPHGARRSELINVNELETFFTGPVHSRPAS